MSNENRPGARSNRLAGEASPYLLQHATNPVDWYPWAPEALARARAEDRPIFLSIGYSSCHWCHVMERESFEDDETAAIMNRHFVNVKVDREERPDLDELYMNAVQAMTGSGGWPMSVFLTPDLRPFYGGTYFPPDDRYGRPGFRRILLGVAEAFRSRRAEIDESAGRLTDFLRRAAVPPAAVPPAAGEAAAGDGERGADLIEHGADLAERGADLIEHGADLAERGADLLVAQLDPVRGGFGSAPKFPQPMNLSLLLRLHHRLGKPPYLEAVVLTLERMARGGIYDQLAGGFHRYATDDAWLVPHFEKMLYDNALLARTYLEAFQVTGNPFFERICRETLDYVLREMTSEEGGFYTATDADSEGVEGRYFVWTPDEVAAVLGPEDGDLCCRFYDVTPGGNWEGRSVLHAPQAEAGFAEAAGLPPAALASRLRAARERLRAAREQRVPPSLDDKLVLSWNALAIGSLARAGRALDEARYGEAAARAARLILESMREDGGRLLRTRRRGCSQHPAYLEDYAFLADALLDLYETTFDRGWLRAARALIATLDAHFWDAERGGYFSTADDHEPLLARAKGGFDNAIPAGSSTAAMALIRLGRMTGEAALLERARRVVELAAPLAARAPGGCGQLLQALEFLVQPSREVVIAGGGGDPALRRLAGTVGRRYLPQAVTLHADPGAGTALLEELPPVAGKTPVDGVAAAYVCQRFACRAPVTDAGDLARLLDGDR